MTATSSGAGGDGSRPNGGGLGTPPAPAYLDEIAVERRCAGDRTVTLDRHEAAEAMRRLHTSGLSIQAVADRLGVCRKTVQRWHVGRTRLPHPIRGTR